MARQLTNADYISAEMLKRKDSSINIIIIKFGTLELKKDELTKRLISRMEKCGKLIKDFKQVF